MKQEPGFFEIETAAHCGHSLKGGFLHSATLTDVFTGWMVNTCVKNRAHRNEVAGIDLLARSPPYPMRSPDFDHGGDFINTQRIGWAKERTIDLTSARANKHSDNAHPEQRNRDWVRRHANRSRSEGPEQMVLLNELWELVNLRKNHLLPMVKANGCATTRSGRRKRTCNTPHTAYQRLLDNDAMDPPEPAGHPSGPEPGGHRATHQRHPEPAHQPGQDARTVRRCPLWRANKLRHA